MDKELYNKIKYFKEQLENKLSLVCINSHNPVGDIFEANILADYQMMYEILSELLDKKD